MKLQISFLLLVILVFVPFITAQNYDKCVMSGENKIEWSINGGVLDLRATLKGAQNGWGAIGFKSSYSAGMAGATITLAYLPASGSPQVNEYTATGNLLPSKNSQNRFTSSNTATEGDSMVFRLVRPTAVPNAGNYANITDTEISLLVAVNNEAKPTSDTSFQRHNAHNRNHKINLFQDSKCGSASLVSSSVVGQIASLVFALSLVLLLL